MSDPSMKGEDLGQAFRRLGKNIRDVMDDAWNSEERVRLTDELEEGLADVGAALDDAARRVAEHPETKRLIDEVDDFSDRVRSGALAAELKREFLEAMDELNTRIERSRRAQPHNEADE